MLLKFERINGTHVHINPDHICAVEELTVCTKIITIKGDYDVIGTHEDVSKVINDATMMTIFPKNVDWSLEC